ncbi:hypothetical protein [Trujillonella humicola]|uniref:hypothetical protein n=1 Tax=Trujillonella humicola TaxID=3383699 RepID=UPI0039061876
MRPVDLPAEAVVIRFTPVRPDRVLVKANQEHRFVGAYGLSVFASAPRLGEDTDTVVRRLLEAAQLDGVNPATNKNYYICSTAAALRDLGFSFYKYEEHEEPNEPPEHYSVDLGSDGAGPTVDAVISFLGAFETRRWTTP